MSFFDVFQLLSVVVFLSIFVIRAAHLFLTQKINPIAIGRGKKGLALIFELIAFGGLIVWISAIVLRAIHFKFDFFPAVFDVRVIESGIARSVGALLVGSALVMFALAFLSFGNSWRVGMDTETPGALVTRGTFAFTRNPIFVSLDLWFIGIFLINQTLGFLIFAIAALIVLHLQMLREEKFLSGLYGEPYREYCARTARYLIW
jgi:protein-S-isoprenylcysteine O-methyltransferase Ste14